MHDLQLKELCGWPDLESAASIVRCIKQSLPVSSPFGAGVTWDCHIVQFQSMDDHSMQRVTRTAPDGNNIITTLNAGTITGGSGLCVYGTLSGVALDLVTSTFIGKISLAQNYNDGATRLLSTGFEVQNTTAPLNKQGQCTVYRLNQPKAHGATFQHFPGGVAGTAFTGSMLRRPPASIAEAMLIPGSRVWKAEDGCYCVTGFLGQDNPPMNPDYNQPVYNVTSNVEDRTDTNNVTDLLIPVPVNTGVRMRFDATKLYPIHMSGAIFSGLSAETTLTLFSNTYIESFPGPAEADILVLATPSAVYDPVALEILSQAMSRLPVGVPAQMNAFGDWFMNAIESVSNFVTPVALALGQPGIAAVSAGIGSGARALGNYLTAPSPQSRPGNQRFVQNSTAVKKRKNKGTMKAKQRAITGPSNLKK